MITRDFHGYSLAHALHELEATIALIRCEGRPQDVEFITGRGIIRDRIIIQLKEYDIQPSLKLGNSGVVKAYID